MAEKIKKKSTNLKTNIFVIVFLDLILIVIISTGIYLIPSQAKSVREIRSQLMAQKISSQNYQKTTADLEAVQSDYSVIEQSLPDAESIVDFIELINKIDQDSNLKLFTFNADLPLKDNQGNHYLPLALVIEDSLPKIINSLNLLQRSNYLFRPVQFTASSPDFEKNQIKMIFDLFIYVDSNFEKDEN